MSDFVFDPTRNLAEMPVDPQSGVAKTWSYSALKSFEECAWRIYLSRVEKKKGSQGEAATRGTTIHTYAEEYIKGEREMAKELKNFEGEFEELRALYLQGKAQTEEDWGFDSDWQPAGWHAPNVWGRFKLDAFVREDETSARIIDFKTGKKFGNEIYHSGQAIMYAIATFMRFPELEYIAAEFFYLDFKEDNVMTKEYSRERAMFFMPKLNDRAIAMTTATEFRPRPSKHNCKWCPFKDEGCEWAQR